MTQQQKRILNHGMLLAFFLVSSSLGIPLDIRPYEESLMYNSSLARLLTEETVRCVTWGTPQDYADLIKTRGDLNRFLITSAGWNGHEKHRWRPEGPYQKVVAGICDKPDTVVLALETAEFTSQAKFPPKLDCFNYFKSPQKLYYSSATLIKKGVTFDPAGQCDESLVKEWEIDLDFRISSDEDIEEFFQVVSPDQSEIHFHDSNEEL